MSTVDVPRTDPATIEEASAGLRAAADRMAATAPRVGRLLGSGHWEGGAADAAGTVGGRIDAELSDVASRSAEAAEVMRRYGRHYAEARGQLRRIASDRAEAVAQLDAATRDLAITARPEEVAVLLARRDQAETAVARLEREGSTVAGELGGVQAATAASLGRLTPGRETVRLAQLRGSTDAAAFDAIPSWFPTRYKKRAIGRDDYDGHKVYFQIPEVTKSRDGKFIYLKGEFRAAAYGRGLPVPTRVETSNTITIKGNDQTGVSWALGGFGGGSPVTIGANAGGGANWVKVTSGDVLKISYPRRASVERNFTAALQIPKDATEIVYKASATFVYADGRTETREIPVSIPLY